ncbi:MAG: DUF4474 domain-containing protein [Lachnospiraceae bacterium]
MYIIAGIIILIALILVIIFYYRNKHIIRKIRCMSSSNKYKLLNSLIKPFGFKYNSREHVYTARLDANQRNFGFTALYDNSAAFFNMVYDCEPVYFNYKGRTWLIEFWKGQYGINTGAEIGIYHTDKIIPESARKIALFDKVSNDELLNMSIELFDGRHSLFYLRQRHWWLAGFAMGHFAELQDLSVELSITFPEPEMLFAFISALVSKGYTRDSYDVYDLTIYIGFVHSHTKCPCHSHRIISRLSQAENRLFCKLYRYITKPFRRSIDRLLFLYYHFPFAFRQMCKIRGQRKGGIRR